MSTDREAVVNALIGELPTLLFTGDPVVDILAPDALEKLARLRKLLRLSQLAAAGDLIERELAPTLDKLEEMLRELVERRVSPYNGMPAVKRVMNLCREFQEVHRPEQLSVATR